MELIYRSTMMKKLTKILCVMLIVFSVFQLVGCDKLSNLGKTEGEKADASEEENEEVTSDEKEEEKPEDGEKTVSMPICMASTFRAVLISCFPIA